MNIKKVIIVDIVVIIVIIFKKTLFQFCLLPRKAIATTVVENFREIIAIFINNISNGKVNKICCHYY